MEQIALRIVSKMLMANLISDNETEMYNYGVQVLLEKVISYAAIFALAMIIHKFLERGVF